MRAGGQATNTTIIAIRVAHHGAAAEDRPVLRIAVADAAATAIVLTAATDPTPLHTTTCTFPTIRACITLAHGLGIENRFSTDNYTVGFRRRARQKKHPPMHSRFT